MLPSPRLVRSAIALARVVPAPLFRAAFSVIGSLGWWGAGARRQVALENARHLAPDRSAAEQRAIARRLFRNLFEAASDLFRLPVMGREGLLELVACEGLDGFRAALAGGRGVIVATGHLGAYELGAAWVAAMGFPVHAMVEDLDPEANAALATYRRATGLHLVGRNTGTRVLYRLLREGQVILLAADRVVGAGAHEGMRVPFGDASRSVPMGPAVLAIATGAPIVVASIVRGEPGGTRYVVRMEAPIDPTGRDRDALAREVAARLDTLTRAHPDQWFVFQPEWLPRDAGP